MNVTRKIVDNLPPSAAERLAAWAPPRKAKSRPRGVSDADLARYLPETEAMMASGDWATARPTHFVCAFELLFARVYGFAPTMSAAERSRAVGCCAGALRDEKKHGGDPASMAAFVHWVWSRERGREQWRRSQGRSGGTITWRVMFGSASLVDEWRADSLRRRGPSPR